MSKDKGSSIVTPFEVKAFDESERTFDGLAATWDLDLGGDVIEKGAFKRTLNSWRGSKKVLPLLDSHNGGSVRNIVGKMLDGTETDDGLEATFKVIEGPDGDEIFRRIKGGYVDGLSIGYSAIKTRFPDTDEEKQRGIWRYLEEVKLHEVSVVLWPMNPEARIDTSSVKALILAARSRDLDETERAELLGLEKQISALLAQPGPAHDAVDPTPILETIRRIKAHRLATRIRATRHSAAHLVTTSPRTREYDHARCDAQKAGGSG